MKPITEVLSLLEEKYDGPILDIRGFSYIPWNETVRQANQVFGPFGWSSEVIKLTEDEGGYSCITRITVSVHDDDRGCSHHITRDGVGYGEIQTTKDGRALRDTAIKTAASDSMSRAFKLIGDAFGLYLYDKEVKEDVKPAQKQVSGGGAAAGKHWSTEDYGAKVLGALRKNKVSDTTIKQMSWQQAKDSMGLFINEKLSASEVIDRLGIGNDAFSSLF